MRALVWHGKEDIRCDTVTDPEIEHPRDAIIKVTSCAICGSDLHLFHNFIPAMMPGDIMGHEIMGEVVEVGSGVNGKLKKGDRVVVPFTIICGECDQCQRGNFSVCETTQPQQGPRRQGVRPHHRGAVRLHPSHRRLSRRPGRISARALRRRDAHQGARRASPTSRLLFLGDIFPTGWQAAVQCDIEPTDTVAIWGCGPVGQMAIRSAILLGAKQVIAIDCLPERPAHGGGRRRHHHQLRGRERDRAAERADRRQGPGEVHRCGRHGERMSRSRSPIRCSTAPSR